MNRKKREMYSVEKELKLLRPFVQKQPPSTRCYSEEEILVVEQRLNYKLPSPLRFMYLYMADLLFTYNYLRPLELLHWDHNHLGFFLSGGNWECIVGICQNTDPNTLYFWEEEDPKDECCEFEDEFEACCYSGDEYGKQRAAQKYLDYWESIENDPSLSQREFNSEEFSALLDEYVLYISLHTLYEDYEALAQAGGRGENPENLNFFLKSNRIEYTPTYIQDLEIKIRKVFHPLLEHTDMLRDDIYPLWMVYLHNKEHILLLNQFDIPVLILLTPKKIAPDVLAEIEHNTGLTFHNWHS